MAERYSRDTVVVTTAEITELATNKALDPTVEYWVDRSKFAYAPDRETIKYLVDGDGKAAGGMSPSPRPTLLVVGNSLMGTSSRIVAAYTATITAAGVRPGANQITLVAGGVAALGLSVNDYIAVGLCSQQPWPVQVNAIAGEVLTLTDRVPRYVRPSAGVSKVTQPTLWPAQHRSGRGYIAAANALLGGPLHLLHGYGYGSGLGSDIIMDLPLLLRHYRPNFVYIQLTENDIAGGASYSDVRRTIDTAVQMCLRAGATPIVESPWPSGSVNTASKSAVWDQIAAYVAALPTTTPGAKAMTHSALWLDTSLTNSRAPLAGWTDGIHANADRVLSIAKYNLDKLQAIIGTRSEVASTCFGPNVLLAGTGGTASGLQSGSVVAANTTITADAGVTCATSKNGSDQQYIDMTIPGASNVTTTTLTITQTVALPLTASASSCFKAVIRLKTNSMKRMSLIMAGLTIGTLVTDQRDDGDFTKLTFLENDALVIESVAIPVRDPSATTATISLRIRPETLSSPSPAEFKGVLESIGLELAPAGEVPLSYS